MDEGKRLFVVKPVARCPNPHSHLCGDEEDMFLVLHFAGHPLPRKFEKIIIHSHTR